MEHGDFPACHVSFQGCGTIFYTYFQVRTVRFREGTLRSPRPKDGHVEILTPAGSTRAEVRAIVIAASS